ncbi:MAG: aldehyde dehydrogenase family protein [Treponema sp.]|jgi:succinate-semialdehyde dehydrogenase/glutarate-semialdehyde dehydrogenase|nr:aldehyde dehydrogenase family protein [Treponema sp.]
MGEKKSTKEIAEIVAHSRYAQTKWAALSYKERQQRLKKAAQFLGDHVDEVTEIIHQDNGKVKLDALATEVLPAVMALSYYIKQGKRLCRDERIYGGNSLMFNKRSRITYKPYGVVGVISPWNYPFAIPFSEVVMALLAGNAVILKVASSTLKVGRILASVFAAAELPAGLFTYVEMPGKEAGAAFIHGGIDKLFFTGSTAVGRALMALAAPRLLPLVLELGGADAAIIRADADIEKAVNGMVWAGFSNAGQSCGGVQRVFVHNAIYEPFLQTLSSVTEILRVGDGRTGVISDHKGMDYDIGPMSSLKQKQAVAKQVEACLKMGAKVAAKSAGNLNDNSLLAPAIALTNVQRDMPIMKEEVFGPVLAVVPVYSDEEAVKLANESSYGLTASVWSRNRGLARKLAARINAGAVMINDHLMSHGLAETPWGGFGDSGLGRTHGAMGFHEMLKAQVIVDDTLPFVKRNLWWQPYSEKTYKGMRAITEMLAGTKLRNRIAAIPDVIKIFFRYWASH